MSDVTRILAAMQQGGTPASGFNEYHNTSRLLGPAFYRTVQP